MRRLETVGCVVIEGTSSLLYSGSGSWYRDSSVFLYFGFWDFVGFDCYYDKMLVVRSVA